MTTKKNLFAKLLALLFIVFTVNSCKKIETPNADKPAPEVVKTNPPQLVSEGIIYKASDSYLKQTSSDFVKNVDLKKSAANLGGGGNSSRSICGMMAGLNNVMQEVYLLPGSTLCPPPTGQVEITYQTTIIEWDMPNQLIYTFNLEAGLFNSYSATSAVVSPITTTVCDPAYPSCYTIYTYTVKFVISAADYVGSGNVTIIATGTCPITNAQTDMKEIVSLYFSNAYYLNSPAKISISPGPGSFSVITECSLICHSPYVQCPTSGTFTYWLFPNGSPITINIPTAGVFNIPAASNTTYSYTCVLNYPFGQSQVNSGTFTTQ